MARFRHLNTVYRHLRIFTFAGRHSTSTTKTVIFSILCICEILFVDSFDYFSRRSFFRLKMISFMYACVGAAVGASKALATASKSAAIELESFVDEAREEFASASAGRAKQLIRKVYFASGAVSGASYLSMGFHAV